MITCDEAILILRGRGKSIALQEGSKNWTMCTKTPPCVAAHGLGRNLDGSYLDGPSSSSTVWCSLSTKATLATASGASTNCERRLLQ